MSVLHTSPPHTEQERLRILSHLEELLESPAFSGSSRRQAFLRYVVEESLAGRGHAIKERNLAVDVFARDNDFDAQSVSIVRVTGGDVRKRLAQAYASGLDHGLRIELPLGSYQPTFHFASVEPPPPAPPSRERVVEPAKPRKRAVRLVVALAVTGVLVAGGLLLGNAIRTPKAADRLWQPFLDPGTPVLISLVALTVPNRAQAPARPGALVPVEEPVPLEMSYVGTGGALGAARFAEQLALRHQKFQLKFGKDVAFADLKHAPAILLGPSRWMEELTRTLRFRVEMNGQRRVIVDSRGRGHEWSVPRVDWSTVPAEGYSLVTRWLTSESGHPILMIAGLDPRDTQAGVEFLSNDRAFETFSQSMPADWPSRSFQVVLHNSIHGNSPGSLSVVASYVW
jgi:hypothetical protein